MQLLVESEMDNRQPAQKASEGAMPKKGGSFAESLAARSGSFAASCSSSSSNVMPFKVVPLSCLPITARASVAVAPGFSPSGLLESPVLLSNSQAEPSPTTGSLMLSRSPNGFSLSSSDSSDPQALEKVGSSDISFKLYPAFNGGSGISPRGFSNSGMKSPSSAGNMALSGDARLGLLCLNASGSDEIHKEHGNHYLQNASEIHKNASPALAIVERRSEDGYNWRKYGQKHVKGSDHPRSYYKCTHPNCQMKKKLELSQDGKITEIIYSGYHDHPKPQPSRRQAIGAMQAGVDDGEKNEFFGGSNRLDDHFDATGTSSPSCSEEEKESGKILREDVEDAESDAKRRKRDDHSFDIIGATRPIREQRVIVQTASEVDILDDGYRWRKYGQKVVKGNPNPRSYYKCTNTGCPVRKHVERASHDPRSVITTYEGKHNHDVPTARYSSNENSMIPSPRPSSVFKSSYAENCDSTAGERSRIANDRSFNLQKHKSDTLGRLFNQNCNETSAGMLELGMAVISTFRQFEPDSGPNTEKLVRS